MLASVAHQLGHGHVVCILDAARDRKIECEQGQRNGNDSVGEEHQPLGGRELDLALDLGYVTLCLRGSETLCDGFGAGPFLVRLSHGFVRVRHPVSVAAGAARIRREWLRGAAAGPVSPARPRTRRQWPESRCHCDNRAESWTQSRSSPRASAHADQNRASVSARR